MLGVSVEVWTKNILYQFIEGSNPFGMPRGAHLSFGPQWTYTSSFQHYFEACTTSGKNVFILYAKQPIGNHGEPTPDGKVPLNEKDGSNSHRILTYELLPILKGLGFSALAWSATSSRSCPSFRKASAYSFFSSRLPMAFDNALPYINNKLTNSET